MIEFKRYPHIEDLLLHYAKSYKDDSIIKILEEGVSSAGKAEEFSLFIWQVVDSIHDDQENEIEVMGSTSNLEMLPDLEYEISGYMRSVGFYDVWRRVSEQA
ncbi:hypothetical protein ACJJIQ_16650 [Microbulbifer sp. ANSA003]|uniref:hypothetical protein n=1 Tax=unclassified Microbulbifer TaxID=2619833 RepID=UPI00403A456F